MTSSYKENFTPDDGTWEEHCLSGIQEETQQRSSLTLVCCPSCSGVGNALYTVRQGSSRETTTTNTVQNVSPLFFPGSFSRFASFKIPNPLVLKRFPLPVLPFYMMQLSVPEVKQLGLH